MLVCAVTCAALAAPATAADPRPQRQGILIALLVPLKGHSEIGTVRFTRTTVSGSVRRADPGKGYRLALARVGCRRFEEGDPDQPIIVGSARIHAEKNQDIEVENDETHVVRDGPVRSAVLIGPGRSVRACGKVTNAGGGAIAALAADDASAVAALAGRRLRAAIACADAATCRLMEEEGIFYFARQPCGKPRSSDAYEVAVDGGARRRDGVVVGFWILDPIPFKARSLRLEVAGEQLACGGLA